MKKIWAGGICVLLVLIVAVFVGSSEVFFLPPEEVPEEKNTEETEFYAQQYPYDLEEYLILPEVAEVVAYYDEPGVCTPEELDEAVTQIRLALAEFVPKEGAVEAYDRVTSSFQMLLEGKELTDRTLDSVEIVVGQAESQGEYAALAHAFIGATVGELRWADYTYPDSVLYGEMAGKTVIVKGVISKVEQGVLPEVNEEFVHQMAGFENATVEEFYRSVEESVLEEKEQNKVAAVWDAFCEGVEILAYPEAELEEYRKDFAAYYENFAKMLETDWDTFLAEYMETDQEGFLRETETYAKEMVKNDMIFTQLIRTLDLSLTKEEYQKGLNEYYETEKSDFKDEKEFEAYYTEEQIRENLLRDKALLYVVENSVRSN